MKEILYWIKDHIVSICTILIIISIISIFSFFYNKPTPTPEIKENYGRFIPIGEEEIYYDNFYNKHYQELVYDKDTKIIYIYDTNLGGGTSLSPFYCMNMYNEPIIAVYDDGTDVYDYFINDDPILAINREN